MKKRNIVVTPALPYVNSRLHIGHILEHTQSHIWASFQKMRGHNVKFVCAGDSHGTPIMLSARAAGVPEKDYIGQINKQQLQTLNDFGFEYDNYSSTDTETNKKFVYEFYNKMKESDAIEKRTIDQLYCEKEQMFLPDRFVKGTCPKCGAEDQNGDSCDNCGATYSPMDLGNPRSVTSGEKLVVKKSEHIFFKLNNYRDFLKEWLPAHTSKEIANKMKEWFNEDLRDWDISRDKPYFGFEVPDEPGKYFYVWLDAPVGYISSTAEACAKTGEDVNDYWKNSDSEVYHFIGKDIIYFHTLFWPAMLKVSGFNTPNRVFVHGFVNTEGEKISKSKGNSFTLKSYLDNLDSQYLRYYFATKLSSKPNDIEFTFEDFMQRVNSDLVGKLINLGSRGAQMLHKNFAGKCSEIDPNSSELINDFIKASEEIAGFYEATEFSKVTTLVRDFTDKSNQYFDSLEPWKLVKTDPEQVQKILTTLLTLFKTAVIYLKPILPQLAKDTEDLFNDTPYSWDSLGFSLAGKEIKPYKHLMKRIDKKQIEAIRNDASNVTKSTKAKDSKAKKEKPSATPKEISIDDFIKVDLRVAEVVKAEHVEGADKLLQLTLNVGEEKTRNVFAGIKSAYTPEDLTGKYVAFVYNLKPRKMKFGMSEGMVLAAGAGGKDLFVISPDKGAKPGDKIK